MSGLDLLIFSSLTFVSILIIVGIATYRSNSTRLTEAEALAEIEAIFNETQRILDERRAEQEGKL